MTGEFETIDTSGGWLVGMVVVVVVVVGRGLCVWSRLRKLDSLGGDGLADVGTGY